MFPVNRPEVLIAAADQKFDRDGRLTDESTRKKNVVQLMKALADWTERLRIR
jgi:chromate reductase, NAD(P)H dehydrogenase (quinone)